MSFTLGWNKRDEEGRRIKIECSLVRTKLTWKWQSARFEQWELMDPAEEDWERLFDTIQRNLRRGKVDPTDVEYVRRLYKQQST